MHEIASNEKLTMIGQLTKNSNIKINKIEKIITVTSKILRAT